MGCAIPQQNVPLRGLFQLQTPQGSQQPGGPLSPPGLGTATLLARPGAGPGAEAGGSCPGTRSGYGDAHGDRPPTGLSGGLKLMFREGDPHPACHWRPHQGRGALGVSEKGPVCGARVAPAAPPSSGLRAPWSSALPSFLLSWKICKTSAGSAHPQPSSDSDTCVPAAGSAVSIQGRAGRLPRAVFLPHSIPRTESCTPRGETRSGAPPPGLLGRAWDRRPEECLNMSSAPRKKPIETAGRGPGGGTGKGGPRPRGGSR